MSGDQRIQTMVGIGNPTDPDKVLLPLADGSLNVNATVIATIGDWAVANAADPTDVEGDPAPGSVDLKGYQRVKTKPSQGALTARSSTIAAGGTSQQLAAANTDRRYLLIQNPASAAGQGIVTAETLYVRFGASAAGVNNGTSFELAPGASLVIEGGFVSTQAIQVNATTIAHAFIAVEG